MDRESARASDRRIEPRYTLAERILIVPAAHVRIADVHFQTEMYELFHRTTGSRIGHLVGTPIVLFGFWMLTAQVPGVASLFLALALLAYIAVWGFAIDRVVGTVSAIGGAAIASIAFGAARAADSRALVVAIVISLGGCAVQTFSHLFEDVPPPQSGTTHFVPMKKWIRAIGPREIARSTALTFTVFYWLELWAAPRIWPLQILHLAMRVGYRPELRTGLDARVAEIIANPQTPWRDGRSKKPVETRASDL